MPSRKYSIANSNYRYGFNGKELDKEASNTTTYDYGFRIYSPALGKFLSVDPLIKKYPELTPYQFASNTPIQAVDLDGAESMFGWSIGLTPKETEGTVNSWNKHNTQIVTGTASGVKKSVTKFWTAITHPWETFKNVGAFIEEVGLDQSTVRIAPTPRLDAIEQDFKDNVVNGNGYTRSEYFAELGTDALLAKGLGKVFSVTKGMALAERINARLNFVKANYGSAIEKYGIDHIDYTKPVSEVVNNGNLINGKRLVQWREPGKTTASPFFTYEGVDPGTLGIPKTYTEKFYVDLRDKYNFLKTTANDVKAFSKADPGVNGMYNGGGTQFYSEEAAREATFKAAN